MRRALVIAAVLISACEQQREPVNTAMPVRMEVVKRSEFAPSLVLAGVVRAAQTIPLTATQRGTLVLAPRFRDGLRTGEQVSKGELIAEVRNDQVLFSRTQAKLQMEAADADHERMARSYRDGVVSQSDYSASELRARLAKESYAASQREVSTLRIVAPASGQLVIARSIASGTIVEAGTPLADIATNGEPLVESAVAASERALVRPGQTVQLTGPGGSAGTARITEVASVIDATGTARVVAAGVAWASGLPLPGTGVEVKVELDRRPDVLTVPDDAIVAGSEGPAVYVAALSDAFERGFRVKRVDVATGGRAAGRVEVTSGVRDGDRVVVSGADALTEDAVVTEAKP